MAKPRQELRFRAHVAGGKLYPTVNLRNYVRDTVAKVAQVSPRSRQGRRLQEDSQLVNKLLANGVPHNEVVEQVLHGKDVAKYPQLRADAEALVRAVGKNHDLVNRARAYTGRTLFGRVFGERAVAPDPENPSAPPVAVGFRENAKIRGVLFRIGLSLQDMGHLPYKEGTYKNLNEWVADVSSKPYNTARVLTDFARLTRAPVFEQIAKDITAYSFVNNDPDPAQSVVLPKDKDRVGVVPRGRNEDRSVFSTRLVSDAAKHLTDQERYQVALSDLENRIAFDETKLAGNRFIEQTNTISNALALAAMALPGGKGWTAALPHALNVSPPVAGALGASAVEMRDTAEPARLQADRYWELALPTLDLIDAHTALAKDPNDSEKQALVERREALCTNAFVKDQEKGVPFLWDEIQQRNTQRALLSTAQSLVNRAVDYGMSPLMVATASKALPWLSSDPMTENPEVYANLSPAQKAARRDLPAVRRRVFAESKMMGLDDPATSGQVLLTSVGDYPAGTKLTPEIIEKLRGTGVTSLPVMPSQLWSTFRVAAEDATDGVATLLAGNLLRGRAAEQLALAAKTNPASRIGQIAERVGSSLVGSQAWNQIAGTEASKALAESARKIPKTGLGRAWQGVQNAVGRLSRLGMGAEKAGQRVADRVANGMAKSNGRIARVARAAGGGLRALGAAGLVIGAGMDFRDAAYYGLSDEGQEAFGEQMDRQVVERAYSSPWENAWRDLVAVPETLFLDKEYARSRIGNAARDMGLFGEGEKNRAYFIRLQALKERRIAEQRDVAMQDLQAVLPDMPEWQLFDAAQTLATRRVDAWYHVPDKYAEFVKKMGGDDPEKQARLVRQLEARDGSAQLERSEYEERLEAMQDFKGLKPQEQQRMREMVRYLGPQAFHKLFLVDTVDDTGQLYQAWSPQVVTSMQRGAATPLPNRMSYGGVERKFTVSDPPDRKPLSPPAQSSPTAPVANPQAAAVSQPKVDAKYHPDAVRDQANEIARRLPQDSSEGGPAPLTPRTPEGAGSPAVTSPLTDQEQGWLKFTNDTRDRLRQITRESGTNPALYQQQVNELLSRPAPAYQPPASPTTGTELTRLGSLPYIPPAADTPLAAGSPLTKRPASATMAKTEVKV